jgi:hypothetical protein
MLTYDLLQLCYVAAAAQAANQALLDLPGMVNLLLVLLLLQRQQLLSICCHCYSSWRCRVLLPLPPPLLLLFGSCACPLT